MRKRKLSWKTVTVYQRYNNHAAKLLEAIQKGEADVGLLECARLLEEAAASAKKVYMNKYRGTGS